MEQIDPSPWMQMRHGKRFDFGDDNGWVPSVDEIALILAELPRFNGCTTRRVSVAEHSILVYQLSQYLGCSMDVRRLALMHDAHECVVGDIPAPFKAMIGETMKSVERRIEMRFLRSLGFREAAVEAMRPMVKKLDLLALRIEQRANLAPSSECDWDAEFDARGVWQPPSVEELQWDSSANDPLGMWLTSANGRRRWKTWSELFIDAAKSMGFQVG